MSKIHEQLKARLRVTSGQGYGPLTPTPGEAVRYVAGGRVEALTADVARLTNWQQGRLVFADRPLGPIQAEPDSSLSLCSRSPWSVAALEVSLGKSVRSAAEVIGGGYFNRDRLPGRGVADAGLPSAASAAMNSVRNSDQLRTEALPETPQPGWTAP